MDRRLPFERGWRKTTPTSARPEPTEQPLPIVQASKLPRASRRALLWPLLLIVAALSGCATSGRCGEKCAADGRITAEVRALINQHPALMAPNRVRVQTVAQVVYLYGQVNTELERSEAEELAQQVSGVKRVVNSIHFSYEGR